MTEKWECSKTHRDSPKLNKITEEKCSPEELKYLLQKMKEASQGNVHFNMNKYRCVAKCNHENYGTFYCYDTQSLVLNGFLRRRT